MSGAKRDVVKVQFDLNRVSLAQGKADRPISKQHKAFGTVTDLRRGCWTHHI